MIGQIDMEGIKPQNSMQRARGQIDFRINGPHVTHLYQSGCSKLMLPKTYGIMREAVLLNTAGGITGGDNLAATFSPELVDLTIYVIDVCMGADIPRKKGPALMKSDMLVINKIELAEHVEVDLEKMREDTKQNRGELPFIFGSMKRGVGLEELSEFLRLQGGFF